MPEVIITREKYTLDDLPMNFDFSAWPLLSSDQLSSATVTSTPSGLTVGTPVIGPTGKTVQVRLQGGTEDATYTLTCVATTGDGYDITGTGKLYILES